MSDHQVGACLRCDAAVCDDPQHETGHQYAGALWCSEHAVWCELREVSECGDQWRRRAEAERDRLRAERDRDIGRMQEIVRDALLDGLVYFGLPAEIDGGVSDGDEYDFTGAEVAQAVDALGDEIERLRGVVRAYLDAYGCIDSACHAPGVVGQVQRCANVPDTKVLS